MNMTLSSGDIRYRGFLTNRGLKLIALFAMTCSQVSALALLAANTAAYLGENVFPPSVMSILKIMKAIGAISFPLLLISSLAVVLDRRKSFGRLILTYFILSVITYLAILYVLTIMLDATVNSLPDILKSLVHDIELDKVPHALATSVMKQIFPGDGTFHPEALSQILSGVGVSVVIPDEAGFASFLEKVGLDPSIAKILFSILGGVDAEIAATNIEQSIASALRFLHLDFKTIWTFISPFLIRQVHAHLNLNMFWDLFLYTTFFYFVCHKPKNCAGGKLILFRACAVLPGLWLLVSALVSASLRNGASNLPDWFIALLAGRNMTSLIVFFLLVLYEKYREAEYLRLNTDEESWLIYQDSNRSSLEFSIYASAVMIVVSILDYFLGKIPDIQMWGIGKNYYMWIAAPILMLFSYNKTPKHKIFNALIPIYYVIHYFVIAFVAVTILYIAVHAILETPIF